MRCLAFVWVSLLFCIYYINIYINIKCCTLHSEPSLHACGFPPSPNAFCFLCELAGGFILAFALWKPTVVICKSCGLEIKITVHVHPLSCLLAAFAPEDVMHPDKSDGVWGVRLTAGGVRVNKSNVWFLKHQYKSELSCWFVNVIQWCSASKPRLYLMYSSTSYLLNNTITL